MEMKYTCCMCKNEFAGNPYNVNGVGAFCAHCEKERINRVKAAQANSPEWDRRCIYCGEIVTEQTAAKGGRDGHENHYHKKCDSNRGWILKCIRHSPKLAEYVQKTEKKEAPLRDERKKLEQVSKKSQIELQLQPTQSTVPDARLDRMERMLNKLTAALMG